MSDNAGHSKTPIDEDEDAQVRAPKGGPAVAPGAGTISPPAKQNLAGGGADMGPAGGPDGADADAEA
ncbi:MAG: hypothetical protein JO303_12185 [Caulobacteraceae bacterium]|nr:hypothetical protein [Caulobacteraceae bacterium]